MLNTNWGKSVYAMLNIRHRAPQRTGAMFFCQNNVLSQMTSPCRTHLCILWAVSGSPGGVAHSVSLCICTSGTYVGCMCLLPTYSRGLPSSQPLRVAYSSQKWYTAHVPNGVAELAALIGLPLYPYNSKLPTFNRVLPSSQPLWVAYSTNKIVYSHIPDLQYDTLARAMSTYNKHIN
jgi:hypothetical protein